VSSVLSLLATLWPPVVVEGKISAAGMKVKEEEEDRNARALARLLPWFDLTGASLTALYCMRKRSGPGSGWLVAWLVGPIAIVAADCRRNSLARDETKNECERWHFQLIDEERQ